MNVTRSRLPKALISTALWAAAFVNPVAAEFQVNTSGGDHERPAVSASNNGFVVVWKDKTQKDVLARRYDASGNELGGEIQVASSSDDEKEPRVAISSSGAFVVAWENGTAKDVHAQRYDANGITVGGPIVVALAGANFGFETIYGSTQDQVKRKQIATQVVLPTNGTLTSITAYIFGRNKGVRCAIYGDAAGEPGMLVAESASINMPNIAGWQTFDLPDVALESGTYWLALAFAHRQQIYYYDAGSGQTRIADNDAERSGYSADWGASSESNTRKISIYATCDPEEKTPSVAMADDGSFVVALQDNTHKDIFVRRYDTGGIALGATIQVTSSPDEETVPSLAMADDGSFVVAWENKTAKDVYAQRYDASGTALGAAIQVTSSSDDEKEPRLAMAGDGSFVVVWENKSAKDVYARRYDTNGIAVGGQIQVTSSSDNEKEQSVSIADDGSFAVAWANKTSKDILLQRYDTDGIALGSAIQVTTSVNDDRRPSISMTGNGRFVVVWSSKPASGAEVIFGQLYSSSGSPASQWSTGWRIIKWVEIR